MSTLVELFTPFRQALDPEINRIAAINFEDFVSDVDMLTVVYYASHPSLWYLKSMKLPVTDFRREAAERMDGFCQRSGNSAACRPGPYLRPEYLLGTEGDAAAAGLESGTPRTGTGRGQEGKI